MLQAPTCMMQPRDRVLATGNVGTLLTLTVMVTVVLLAPGLPDALRGRIMARFGVRLDWEPGSRAPAGVDDDALHVRPSTMGRSRRGGAAPHVERARAPGPRD